MIHKSTLALALLSIASCGWAQTPAATYDGGLTGNASIQLNIGNGGAGQSGLIKGETVVASRAQVALTPLD